MKRTKRLLAWILSMALTLSCVPVAPVSAQSTAFEGYTPISTKEELNAVRNDLSGKYYLTTDIVFAAEDFNAGGAFYNDGAQWIPIGTPSAPFRGVFDGNGYTISGLNVYINGASASYGGLFGYVNSTSSSYGIFNVGMLDTYVFVSNAVGDGYAGAIAGYCEMGTIQGCYNTGYVAATSDSGTAYAGGILGGKQYGIIDSCYNTGTVVGGGTVGGIVGTTTYASISNCYNTTGKSGTYAGGIAGSCSFGSVEYCYSLGECSSSYGSGFGGGIVGMNSNCSVSNSYYTSNTTSGGGTKKTDSAMQSQSTFSGFDFSGVWTMEGNSEYAYPELRQVTMYTSCEATHISLDLGEVKTSYLHKTEALDVTGGTVTVHYDNNTSARYTLTADMVSGFDNTVLGVQTLTVSFKGMETAFQIEIIPFTVVFVDHDGTVLSTATYAHGEQVVLPEDPVRAADETYTYSFAGWTPAVEACTANATYTAQYRQSYIDYTVTFLDWDGAVISSETYHYGDAVQIPAAPTRADEGNVAYTFTGWDNTVSDTCTGDATYTAQYSSEPLYTVTFVNWDGTLISSKQYRAGQSVTLPADPERPATNTYRYVFSGWEPAVAAVTGDVTYTAAYEQVYIDYTVIFKNDDGSVLSEKTYHYGDTVIEPDAPTKASDDTYTYTFSGWDKEVASVSGDTVYTAVFEAGYIDYTVKFLDWDGSVLLEATYHYGDTVSAPQDPVRQPDGETEYVFDGWEPEVGTCNGDGVYTAKYKIKSDIPEGLEYSIQNNNTEVRIDGYTGTETELVIPKTIEGLPVTSICSSAFYNNTTLTSLVLGENIQTLGSYAVYNCTNLRFVSLPASITAIYASAFYNCASVCHVAYAGTQSQWQNVSVYSGNTNITSNLAHYETSGVGLYSKEEKCSVHTYYCAACESVVLTEQKDQATHSFVDGICQNCGVDKNWSYTIADNGKVTISAYNGTQTELQIPQTIEGCQVTAIGQNAFYNYTQLQSITIPDSVNSIGSYAFYGCSGLTGVYISSLETWCKIDFYDSYSNPLRYAGKLYVNNEQLVGMLTIPDSIGVIGDYAFYGLTGLTGVTIHPGVSTVGNSAFYGCSGLTGVYISDLESWCQIAFYNEYSNPLRYAKKLYVNNRLLSGTLTIPDSITNVKNYAFYGNAEITGVKLHDGITQIGYDAFRNNSNLRFVYVPQSVTYIYSYAFYGCSKLCHVFYGGTRSQWPEIGVSGGNTLLQDATVHYLVTEDIVEQKDGCALRQYNCKECDACIFYEEKAEQQHSFVDGVCSACGVQEGLQYQFNDAATFTVTGYVGTDTALVIPGQIEGVEVAEITAGALSGCSLESLTIPFVGGSVKTVSQTYQYPFGYIFGTDAFDGAVATQQSYFGSTTNYTTQTTYYIPASLRSVNVTGGNILRGAFYNCSNLESVKLPDDLKTVGHYAFYGCSSLTDMTIPQGVTAIQYDAFNGCSSLTALEIPNTVTTIGSDAFSGCRSLTSMEIPNTVTSLGSNVFDSCSGLQSITLPFVSSRLGTLFGTTSYTGSVKVNQYYSSGSYYTYYFPAGLTQVAVNGGALSYGAFYNCSFLTKIELADEVTEIGERAFYGCRGLTQIRIPESVESIGSYAFAYCELEKLEIPAGLKTIGANAFRYGTVDEVHIADLKAWCELNFGASPVSTNTKIYCNGTLLEDYLAIPEGTQAIHNGAFSNYGKIVILEVPASVTAIGADAFYNDGTLKHVLYLGTQEQYDSMSIDASNSAWNNAVLHVGATTEAVSFRESCTFSGEYCSICEQYIRINPKDQSHNYEDGVCTECNQPEILRYSINTSKQTVSVTGCDEAYQGVIVIPETIEGFPVTSIGSAAFENCTGLSGIKLPDGLVSIGSDAFNGCSALTEIAIPDRVTSIGYDAFYNCTGLAKVTFGKDSQLTTIGSYAFYNCTALTQITIPASLTSISSGAFHSCTNLKDVYITDPSAWCKVDTSYYAYNLMNYVETLHIIDEQGNEVTEVVLDESVTQIPEYAFKNAVLVTDIALPESVVSIGGAAFYDCAALEEITFGKNSQLSSIGDSAFWGCSALTQITIPQSVISIGSGAFSGCDSLQDVYITDPIAWCRIEVGLSGSPMVRAKALHILDANGEEVTEVVLDETVTQIPDYAFKNCAFLTDITIPDTVTVIGEYAFQDCTGLTEVTFGESSQLTSIERYAFYGCSALREITIPDGVTSIGDGVFRDCVALTGVTFSENNQLTSIEYNTFRGCTALTEIAIPEGVTFIDSFVFFGCTNLVTVSLPVSLTEIADAFGESGLHHILYAGTAEQWAAIKQPNYSDGEIEYAKLFLEGKTPGEFTVTQRESCSGIINHCSYCQEDFFGGNSNAATHEFTDGVCQVCGVEEVWVYVVLRNGTVKIISYTGTSRYFTVPETIEGLTVSEVNISAAVNKWFAIGLPASVSYVNTSMFGANYIRHVHYGGTEAQWRALVESSHPESYPSFDYDKVTVRAGLASLDVRVIDSCSGTVYYCNDCQEAVAFEAKEDAAHSFTDGMCDQCGVEEHWSYRINDVGEVSIRKYNGSETDIQIPAAIESMPVVALSLDAFYDSSITSVVIPDTVETIGSSAFYSCDDLTSVDLGEGVKTIESSAFMNCGGLRQITIPASVSGIDTMAFWNCYGLESVDFLGSAPEIADDAFGTYSGGGTGRTLTAFYDSQDTSWTEDKRQSYGGITNWVPKYADGIRESGTFADGLTWKLEGKILTVSGNGEIPRMTWDQPWRHLNAYIEKVVIGEGITAIGGYVFDCENLKEVSIANSVTQIAQGAFSGTKLTYVFIPAGVTMLSEAAFEGSSQLAFIEVAAENETYCSDGRGIVYSKDTTKLVRVPYAYTGELVIPAHVNTLSDWAAESCSNITKVTIQGSLIEIPYNCFGWCTSLAEINIPDGVYWIGSSAFYGCSALTKITIPDSVRSIGMMAFQECTALTSVTIPANVSLISEQAFCWSGLTEIRFAGDAPSISESAFGYVTATAYYPKDNATWTEDRMLDYGGDLTWETYVPGEEDKPNYNGLVEVDGVWGYYIDGELQTEFTGLVDMNGTWFYVENGLVNWDYSGLCLFNGVWLYVNGGCVEWGYTGLVLHNGYWMYVSGGMVDWEYVGLTQYNGWWFYVANGFVDWEYVGMTCYNGWWFYVANGLVDWEYNSLTQYNGYWFYIDNGMVDWYYVGLVPFNGALFYVQNGMVDWSYNGTANYGGVEYQVVGGIAQ